MRSACRASGGGSRLRTPSSTKVDMDLALKV